jgi:hypothetical protein
LKNITKRMGITILLTMIPALAAAEEADDAAAAMARALQDPLANIAAIMTDNDIYIGTGDGQASTVLQIQPVYSLNFDSFSLIPRGVFPIIGLAPEAKLPPTGEPAPAGGSTSWGLGDSVLQLFWTPKSKGSWKWGVGPQVSLDTSTKSQLSGAGWGGGVAGILVGILGANTSFAAIAGQLWGQNGFSTTLLQPMIFYNFPKVSGLAIAYNGAITYDHSITEGDKLQLPIGFVINKTTNLGGGYGLDLLMGPYYYPIKPNGGPDWSFKFGITLLMPKG